MPVAAVCRIGDSVSGTCTQHVPAVAWTGTWGTGSAIFTSDGIGVVRVGDTGLCSCGHTFQASVGSTVAADSTGKALVRVGDPVIVIGGGTGVTLTGSPVFVSA